MTDYALVGLIDVEQPGHYDGRLCALILADQLTGVESVVLHDATLPTGAKIFTDLCHAMNYGDVLFAMDRRLYPPFNPTIAEVEFGHLAALLLPPEARKGDELIRTAALRYGIPVRRLS